MRFLQIYYLLPIFFFKLLKVQFVTDYPDYTQYTTTFNKNAIKYEDENEEKYKIPENNGNTGGYTQEEGEYDESNDY